MEREPQSATARLIEQMREKLPYTQFYRFCQLLEQSQPDAPALGSHWQVKYDPVRFRPHPGMGFPASEFKRVEFPDEAHLPPTIRTTFMGLYGVESPLPTAYIDDITQRRDGHEAVSDFLDIFNHRMITQYYRIWRKYSYPATFVAGGTDRTSKYLLSLCGLGIDGCAKTVATPVSRFLALTGMMRLPTRTSEGVVALVTLLAPDTQATVMAHDKLRIPLRNRLAMSARQPVSMRSSPVMGTHAVDVNSQILLNLNTRNTDEAREWLPGGQLHTDLMALLHVYLGSRLHVRMQLSVLRSLLPDARLSCQPKESGVLLGRTAVMRTQRAVTATPVNDTVITINLGRYQRVQENPHRRETDEHGDYRW
ncbi:MULTISPECIES: type VI secretion system baseplate subunit TssG [Rahnella]|uniref:Type VI secretion system baseplate subunit TssG n=1 Tax=Rahnella laticis TaxID=2787622 RepID=A0ABS0E1M3_9GAMM|nr:MULTISPECIES: type VI secretion system baseplate subunit TssG [Rahnella]MBF7978992.1 type VI secretion system baseplate subunit TssG [Rahnella laticis]MBF7999082.1 type VI secretion system baseplate subunit TssG [Rahnella sp. LAC-M12]